MLIEEISEKAKELHSVQRELNRICSGLSGTAVTIPRDLSTPLHDYEGIKIIIHNVNYSADKRCVVASITLPYLEKHRDRTFKYDGHIIEVCIDETWYPELGVQTNLDLNA